jgi:hypothetical protein
VNVEMSSRIEIKCLGVAMECALEITETKTGRRGRKSPNWNERGGFSEKQKQTPTEATAAPGWRIESNE